MSSRAVYSREIVGPTVVRNYCVRCSGQKLTDPFGVLRPEFNHVNNVTQTHHNLLILKSDGVFADHNDFSKLKNGVRGKYVARYRKGTNLVLLSPDIA